MRVVSFLPAATEIVCALGASRDPVGVSHDCHHPSEVQRLPRITRSLLGPEDSTGGTIDQAVREGLAGARRPLPHRRGAAAAAGTGLDPLAAPVRRVHARTSRRD